jgi:hypothetical protein
MKVSGDAGAYGNQKPDYPPGWTGEIYESVPFPDGCNLPHDLVRIYRFIKDSVPISFSKKQNRFSFPLSDKYYTMGHDTGFWRRVLPSGDDHNITDQDSVRINAGGYNDLGPGVKQGIHAIADHREAQFPSRKESSLHDLNRSFFIYAWIYAWI